MYITTVSIKYVVFEKIFSCLIYILQYNTNYIDKKSEKDYFLKADRALLLLIAFIVLSCSGLDNPESSSSEDDPYQDVFTFTSAYANSVGQLTILYSNDVRGTVQYVVRKEPLAITDKDSFSRVCSENRITPRETVITDDKEILNNYITVWNAQQDTLYYCYILWVDKGLVFDFTAKTAKKAVTDNQRTYTHANGVRYLLHLPYNYDKGSKKWPVIVFGHGGGQATYDAGTGVLSMIIGPPRIAENDCNFPFIVFSAQQADSGNDTAEKINEALQDVLISYDGYIDNKRIYLTGYSQGSIIVKRLAGYNARLYAVMHTLGGYMNNALWAQALGQNNVTTWTMINEGEGEANVARAYSFHTAIKNASGGRGKQIYTVHAGGHTSSIFIYSSPYFYRWLAAQGRK